MEVLGTVLSVAQTLFAALQSAELKEFFSVIGYESQLEDLHNTVSTIKAVFQDAERKQTLSAVEQKLIEDLKEAVYEADDLLDEFVTIAEQKQLLNADGGISKKVHQFLSRTNPFGVAYRMSKGVKKIKKKLDAIAYNKQFKFDYDPEPIRKTRPETCSYVDAGEIIGRKEDLDKIVGMLLDPDVKQDVSFLGIVGIGGLGKTALAQLVYNDPRITSVFTVRKWACISDEDQNQLDVKEILGKIVASATCDYSTLDQIQGKLRHDLEGNKYLLVLDDVWTEKRDQWRSLAQYFVGGQRGSWIVVTTRSQRTARILGDGQVYMLEGLSKEYSWQLFRRMAFEPDKSSPTQDLVEIGQGLVEKCARIPLAIRILGSLLYGQDKRKWQLVLEMGLNSMRDNENGIIPILKLSYYHLESSLKSCFSYCAIFPKDFEIEKKMLISLWMAQGYVVPLNDGQSIEDAGEEYFSILLRRCFFQDIKENGFGDIRCVKIHDLMHDLAQSVSVKEICATSTIRGNFDRRVRHFSFGNTREYGNRSFRQSHIRSLICTAMINDPVSDVFVEKLIASCRCLRALNLRRLMFRSLPDSIGTLLHLRYLDLSDNSGLEVLPKSIAKLCNLETLILNYCTKLKELPKDLNKLIKLRVLSISYCYELSYMPRGMDKLICLSRLSDYKVGGNEMSCSSWKKWFDGLEVIKALENIKGCLHIHIKWPKNVENIAKEDDREKGLYLRNKEHLNHIIITFIHEEGDERMDDEGAIALMEDLHPHPNLKLLVVWRYFGTRIPDWVSFSPNLVMLRLFSCKELEYLSCFESAREVSFLPLIEDFWLKDLPKLKGIRRDASNGSEAQMQEPPFLSHLKSLRINSCPQLVQFPTCPNLENLALSKVNRRLIVGEAGTVCTSSCKEVLNPFPKLRKLTIDDVAVINLNIQSLEELHIVYNEEVESLGEFTDLFRSCCSSLRRLEIYDCHKLKYVMGGGLEHLNTLEELMLCHCYNLKLCEEEIEGVGGGIMSCSSLLPSLHTLKLDTIPTLENLPNWMQNLTALQSLEIKTCPNLKAMPNWMPKLTSLRNLQILRCSKSVERRCRKDPPGEDWPFVQHIPSIYFLTYDRF